MLVATLCLCAVSLTSPQPRVELPREEISTETKQDLRDIIREKAFRRDLMFYIGNWLRLDPILKDANWGIRLLPVQGYRYTYSIKIFSQPQGDLVFFSQVELKDSGTDAFKVLSEIQGIIQKTRDNYSRAQPQEKK